jgi:hypothetical protein
MALRPKSSVSSIQRAGGFEECRTHHGRTEARHPAGANAKRREAELLGRGWALDAIPGDGRIVPHPESRRRPPTTRRRTDEMRLPDRQSSSVAAGELVLCYGNHSICASGYLDMPAFGPAVDQRSRTPPTAGRAFSDTRSSTLATRLKPASCFSWAALQRNLIAPDLRRTCVGRATPSNAAWSSPRVQVPLGLGRRYAW